MPKIPKNKREWQDALDTAHALLVLDSARQYGLVKGGPAVNVRVCEQLKAQAEAKGLRPSADAVEQLVLLINARGPIPESIPAPKSSPFKSIPQRLKGGSPEADESRLQRIIARPTPPSASTPPPPCRKSEPSSSKSAHPRE